MVTECDCNGAMAVDLGKDSANIYNIQVPFPQAIIISHAVIPFALRPPSTRSFWKIVFICPLFVVGLVCWVRRG